MKKILVSIMLIVSCMVVATIAYAAHRHGTSQETSPSTTTNIEDIKTFQKEALSLRDDLITKRFELKNEYSKSPKDYNRIATLRKEIAEIRTKIEAIADKYAIKDIRGRGHGMRGGMMHDGMGHGRRRMMYDDMDRGHEGMMGACPPMGMMHDGMGGGMMRRGVMGACPCPMCM